MSGGNRGPIWEIIDARQLVEQIGIAREAGVGTSIFFARGEAGDMSDRGFRPALEEVFEHPARAPV